MWFKALRSGLYSSLKVFVRDKKRSLCMTREEEQLMHVEAKVRQSLPLVHCVVFCSVFLVTLASYLECGLGSSIAFYLTNSTGQPPGVCQHPV